MSYEFLDLNPKINKLVSAFTTQTENVTDEIASEYNLITRNFSKFGGWDVIFTRLAETALMNGLIVLVKRRGPWDFVAVLNSDTEDLYVFTKEKNIDTVIKKFGKDNIHYFHALVSKNGEFKNLDNAQLDFFSPTTDEFEMNRIAIAQKVLGKDYADIQRVVFIVSKEVDKKIVGTEARLYDKYFNKVNSLDLTEHISYEKYEYEDVSTNVDVDEVQESVIIAKVKEDLKNKKTNPKLADRKKQKDELEDKNN